MHRPRMHYSPEQRARVIEEFSNTGRIDLACSLAGVCPEAHYRWLKRHPAYKAAFQAALRQAVDLLEAEAWRRAHDGCERPVVSHGRIMEMQQRDQDGKLKFDADDKPVMGPLVVREYSDLLIQFLLKGRRREVYGDKTEFSNPDGSPLGVKVEIKLTGGLDASGS